MRKFILLALSAVLLSSCSRKTTLAGSVSADDVPTVAVARVTSRNLTRTLVLTAEFKPFQDIDVMAKVSGYVKQINVDIGDRVKNGSVACNLGNS